MMPVSASLRPGQPGERFGVGEHRFDELGQQRAVFGDVDLAVGGALDHVGRGSVVVAGQQARVDDEADRQWRQPALDRE